MAYLGRLSTDAYGFTAQEVKIAAIDYNAVEAAAAGPVHAAITALTTKDVVTETEITNPPCARCLVVAPGGTTDSVVAGNITVRGTNINNEPIEEAFAFLAKASAEKTGLKAFKTIKSITIPQHTEAGATYAVTFGDKIGLPYKLTAAPYTRTVRDGTQEATAPTFAVSADDIALNNFKVTDALDGEPIRLYLYL
jgi:hypothetical protein